MALNIMEISELVGRDVFTDKGHYCGKTSDVDLNLPHFHIRALVVEAARGSFLAEQVGGKKGVVVPYGMVKAIGDVVIIKHFSVAGESDEKIEEDLQI